MKNNIRLATKKDCERMLDIYSPYASEHRSRAAYSWSCEVGVYISNDHQRQGVGKELYTELFNLLKTRGYYNVFAGITLPNNASVGLHKTMGFREIGIYKNIGFKLGAWHDVAWYQRELNSGGTPNEIVREIL